MKNIHYIIAIIILTGLSSCQKFLDKPKPEDSLSPGSYFQTAEQLDFAIKGVYDILQSPELYRSKFHYLKGWEAEEGFARARNFTTQLNSNEFTSSTSDVFTYWRDLYKGIARANILIANVDNNVELSKELRDQIRGEALFLRGYYYFLLVQSWGGVPLVITPTTSIENTDLAKSTDVEIYQQIVTDMTQAETLVPKITTLGFGGRINKSAVRGILARVNLQWAGFPIKDVSKYAEALKWSKMVMDDAESAHALNPKYSDVFIKVAQDKYDIKESLWEVEFSGNGVGIFAGDAGQVGYNTGAISPAIIGTAPGYVWVTATLYNSYLPGDQRRGWNVQNFSYNTSGLKTFKPEPVNQEAIYSLSTAKWRREYETFLPKQVNLTPQNFQILRYADVLLMFAEAENQISGPTVAAQNAVNLVRRRAYALGGIKSITVTNGGTTTYTTPPSVVITGGGGTGGAVATAVLTAGKVSAVNLTLNDVTGYNYGSYATPPTISFTGGEGSGATATASLFSVADADMPTNLSSAGFLTFLQKERSRELCFESLRKFDLIRWGIYVSSMQAAANTAIQDGITGANAVAHFPLWYKRVEDKFNLLPVPAQDLTNNKLLVQNPGWN